MSNLSPVLLLLLVAGVLAGPFKPTSDFWSKKLNYTVTFESYAGYEEINRYRERGQSGMFYQLYSLHGSSVNKSNPDIPLLIWLQGGPGSSSQFGAHTQVGPIKIVNGRVTENDYAWNLQGHLLFIDSPLNTGFSYSGDRTGDKQVSNTDEATNHLMNFLDNFYETWPALRSSPLYITGESFAGHYIPSLAWKILNKKEMNVTLAGISIGDGWTDPINQINYYDTYLWSVGVIDRGFRETCTWYQTNSMINIHHSQFQKATEYFDFLTNNDTTPEYYMGNISIFDFRNYNGLDTSFAKILEDNKAEFGVSANVSYIIGNQKIYTAFGEDITQSYADLVAKVVRQVKVLIYNGQNDVVVNTPGVMLYLNSLNWEGIHAWKKTPKRIWTIHDDVQGWAKINGNLWFVLVNGAGHMVPTNKPVAAFNMLAHFLTNNHDWRM